MAKAHNRCSSLFEIVILDDNTVPYRHMVDRLMILLVNIIEIMIII